MKKTEKNPDLTRKVQVQKNPSNGFFLPGTSGNPAGRPKGSRNKLNEDFIRAMSDDFSQHGISVIQTVRCEKPDVYLKVVASLQPKEIDIRDRSLDDLSDEEVFDALAAIRSIKQEMDKSGTRKPRSGEKAAH